MQQRWRARPGSRCERRATERTPSGAYAAAERAYAAAVDLWPPDDPERPALLLRYGRTLSLDRDAGSEELTEARDGFLASDQRDAAAEAELLIGDLAWRRGMGEEAQTHIERAMTLADGLPPTPELAAVKSHLARYFMVAGRHDDAIRIGREALAIAQDLDLADLQAFAMSSLGTALINRGDTDEGFRDLEEGIAIAERANSPWHLTRGQVNLGVSYFLVGDVSAAIPVHERNLEAARRFGIQGAIIWNLAEVAFDYCLAGRWDESLAIHDAEIARIEAGAPHYIETQHRHSRSRIRLGRGDLAGALEDADRAVEAGREAGDPQALLPCLAERARTLLVAGRGEEAEAVVSEILRSERRRTVAGLGVVDPPGVRRAHGAGPWRRSPGLGGREPPVGLGAGGAALGIGRLHRRGGPPPGDGRGAGRGVRADASTPTD